MEYDEMKLPNDGLNDDGTTNPDSVYNAYIVKKYQPIFRQIEKDYASIRSVFAGEDCDFRIEFKDGDIVSMHIAEK